MIREDSMKCDTRMRYIWLDTIRLLFYHKITYFRILGELYGQKKE